MSNAGALVQAARTDAGLSMRALAARAHVAYTTVSRIEHGLMDPTVGMLTRLLQATGHDLTIGALMADGPQLANLADAWTTTPAGHDRPDWTRLRAFTDYLAAHPHLAGPSILRAPAPTGSAVMDNFLAAIAEEISLRARLPRPGWARRVRRLDDEWVTPGTPRMREQARAATPEPFARRGITMRADSLWREPNTVGL